VGDFQHSLYRRISPPTSDIGSRVYLHHPPGEVTDVPDIIRKRQEEYEAEQPKMNQLSCVLVFLIVIPFTAVTAEWVRPSLSSPLMRGPCPVLNRPTTPLSACRQSGHSPPNK
jgi:hypothetical protein